MPVLADKQLCTGCTACVNTCPSKCIVMEKDKAGFSYPVLTNPAMCLSCGACEQICPVINGVQVRESMPSAYAAYSKDDSIRMESSSGGVFSELAQIVLHENGVVYGAAYDHSTWSIYHRRVEDPSDLGALRGAKYAESDLGYIFEDVQKDLNSGKAVLFAGTPCQVAGLRAFLRRDYPGLLCVDFVCHGIPSPMVWETYVKYRAEKDANGMLPCLINLRAKHTGWSHYRYSNLFQYRNGKTFSLLSQDSAYMKLFVGDYISRPACASCMFKGYKRVSDITLGDFWGIWDLLPEMDDNKGTSVVLLQSEKGQRYWNEISEKMSWMEVELSHACKQNPSMLQSSAAKERHDEVLDAIRQKGFQEGISILNKENQSYVGHIKNRVKDLLYAIGKRR